MSTKLDGMQVLKESFDEANSRIRVDAAVSATISDIECVIDQTNDSIRIGDGTDLVTTTTVGSDVGLDVNVIQSVLPNGASTAANQSTIISHLDGVETTLTSIDAGIPVALGQTTMANSMPVVLASDQTSTPHHAYAGTLTDFSGTATNVSTQVMPSNSNRKYLFIQNATGNIMWINFGVAATNAPPSIELAANSTFIMEGSFVSTQQVNAIRNAAANVAYTAKEGT